MKERDELLNTEEPADAGLTPESEAVEDAATEEDGSSSEGEMTLVGWLWRLCIPIIPCAGLIIYIVLLSMWAFGKKQTESMRVWAKAALIATVIQLVFFGVILLVLQLNLHLFDPLTAILKRIF